MTQITISVKDRVAGFVWQHILLAASLFVMTFGVALCVRSSLGSSVISTIPFILEIAGKDSIIPALTIGEWTYVMNFIFVVLQVIILGRMFEPVQLFQLAIGFVFGWFLDLNMSLTALLPLNFLTVRIVSQLAGCTILAAGIAFELRCGSVTMPGEGLPAAISKRSGQPFPRIKINEYPLFSPLVVYQIIPYHIILF